MPRKPLCFGDQAASYVLSWNRRGTGYAQCMRQKLQDRAEMCVF